MRTYFSFGLNLRDIPNSITPQNHTLPATDSSRTARTLLYPPVQAVSLTPPPPFFFPVLDRRALQQLALNVHVKHSDLT